jgi:hypothetical protein
MAQTLPERPAKYVINQVLEPNWDPADAVGFDLGAAAGTEAFLPAAPSLDNVGAHYPSLVVQFSNETSGGETTYDYISGAGDGPGQIRQGTLLAIARAETRPDGYTGDSANHSVNPAGDVVVAIVEAVENAVIEAADGSGLELDHVGSQRGPDAPDDFDVEPPVKIANTQISYSWRRD